MATLESDPRFRVLSASWSKYINSAEGKLLMEFMQANRPRTNISHGTEIAATTGSFTQGYNDAVDFLYRLSEYREQAPKTDTTDALLSGRTENNPFER